MLKNPITITHDGVLSKISMDSGTGHSFSHTFHSAYDWCACLLVDRLQDMQHRFLSTLAKNAYDLGWQDRRKGLCKEVHAEYIYNRAINK